MSNSGILIADAGSTKIDWCLVGPDGNESARFETRGINAAISTADKMTTIFLSAKEYLGDSLEPYEIFYYGAGCATPEISHRVAACLREVWREADCRVSTDMLGAARALLGDKKGIACILGTGSNSCLYDGKDIIANVPPLGFILGDEGSGAVLGRRLIGDIYKGIAPDNLRRELNDAIGIPLSEIIRRVYREPDANRFLASFVPFIKDNISNPHIIMMVSEEFDRFFMRNVALYEDARILPVNFIGSVAYNFQDLLKDSAARNGFNVGIIERMPMAGLISYHTQSSK